MSVEIVGRDAGHARQLLRDALDRDTDALVVVGGDGIISLALQELAGGDVPLGIIPAGTGNDHAREFGSPPVTPRPPPTSSPTATRRPSTSAHRRRRRHAKWFGTVSPRISIHWSRDRANRMRWPHGRMRYNLAMIAELSKLRLLPFRLIVRRRRAAGHRIDDGRVRQHEKLRRRHAHLPRRRPDRRPARRHHDHLGVTHPAGPAVPHRVQGHARRPRHGVNRGAPRPSRSSARASAPTPTAISPVCCPPRSPPFPAPCGC